MREISLNLAFIAALGTLASASSFGHKLASKNAAHNTLFHDRLLAQLSSLRTSASSEAPSPLSPFKTLAAAPPDNTTSPFADGSSTSFVLYTSDVLPVNPAPPSACAQALTASIACNSTVPLMSSYALLFQDSNNLVPVCTTGCASALANYRASVARNCPSYSFTDSANSTFAATYVIDSVLSAYTVQCLRDSTTNQFCGPLMSSFTATQTGGLLSLPNSQLCTFCPLETLNITLSNPTTFSYPGQDLLSQAVQKCGPAFNQYAVTAVPTQVVTPAPTATFGVPSATPVSAACAFTGRTVTVSVATTCAELGEQYQVSTYDIRSSNPGLVDSSCVIAAPATLCIPQACTLYTVKDGDTCDSVARAASGANLTSVQLTSINPELGVYCQSMASLVNSTICISPNGGWPDVGVVTTAIPSATPTAVAPVPTPTGPGSTAACGRWYLTQDGDYCNSVILANGITLTDFLTMNPEVDANCTNLWLGYNYCVAPFPPLSSSTVAPIPTGNFSTGVMNTDPLPTASYTPTWYTSTLDPVGGAVPTNVANGTRTLECGYYYDVASGDTVDAIASEVGLNASVLETWNPQLANSPPVPGTSICVIFPTGNYTLYTAPRPGNAAADSTKDCAQWYSVVSGDGCASIESAFGLTSAEFFAMNPGVGSDCRTLQLGVSYCVLSIYAPGYSTTPPPTGPPSNIASGSFTNCTSYATVQSGQTCSTLETGSTISLTDLLRWNPELDASCVGLQAGAAYCVGGGGNACSKLYTVVSGDFCSLIESKTGVSGAQLQTYNPWMDANCDLQVGQVLCVGPFASGTPTSSTTSSTTTTTSRTTTTSAPASTPTNIASGSWTNCTSYYSVQSGDSCTAIDTRFKIAFSDFLRWNPEISTSCSNLQLAAYCVKATPACAKIYTVASGDFCSKIETANGITDARLRSLNTWIDAGCDLQVGQNLCVG